MRWCKPLLLLLAVVNVVWGLIAISVPRRAAELVQLFPTATGGLSELRAVYGGLFVAFGYLILLALRRADGAAWLRVLGFAFVGLAAGRAVSLLVDGSAGYTWLAFALEGAGAALLLLAAPRLALAQKA